MCACAKTGIYNSIYTVKAGSIHFWKADELLYAFQLYIFIQVWIVWKLSVVKVWYFYHISGLGPKVVVMVCFVRTIIQDYSNVFRCEIWIQTTIWFWIPRRWYAQYCSLNPCRLFVGEEFLFHLGIKIKFRSK